MFPASTRLLLTAAARFSFAGPAHLAGDLFGDLALLLVAAVAGVAVAYLLYHGRLRWTWAVPLLVVGIFAWPAQHRAGAALAVASLTALRLGRRWHRRDLFAGGDVARVAAARRGVLQTLLAAGRHADARQERWVDDFGLLVGHEASGAPVRIPVGGAHGASHTLVVGATGSGKTVTQTWIVLRCLEQGMGAVVVDPKGDAMLARELQACAQRLGRRFIAWSPDGPATYNPLARGSETEIVDKALAGERFTEPHYLRQAQRYLGHAVRVLQACGQTPSLAALVAQLEPGRLELLARNAPEEIGQVTFAYLDSLTARQARDLAGVRDRLAVLAESDAARWLGAAETPDGAGAPGPYGGDWVDGDESADGGESAEGGESADGRDGRDGRVGDGSLDLLAALRERAVVYFALEADRRPLLAQMLGAAIVQDLVTVVAASQSEPLHAVVAIDEFAAVAAEQVTRLFGRARSAGLSLVLATQELADLRPAGRATLLDQVLGNLGALIAHRQVVPDSASIVATIAGTRAAWSGSLRPDGEVTRTRTRELALHPDQIRGLQCGCAAVVVPGGFRDGGDAVRVASIMSPRVAR